MTREEQVLMDALAACGFMNLDLWSLRCLDSALAATDIRGRDMARLVHDLSTDEAGIHTVAAELYRQEHCHHPRARYEGRVHRCPDCNKTARFGRL